MRERGESPRFTFLSKSFCCHVARPFSFPSIDFFRAAPTFSFNSSIFFSSAEGGDDGEEEGEGEDAGEEEVEDFFSVLTSFSCFFLSSSSRRCCNEQDDEQTGNDHLLLLNFLADVENGRARDLTAFPKNKQKKTREKKR